MTIKEIADNYQKEYGFMALNAVYKHAGMFASVHAEFMNDELEHVKNELIRRGVTIINSEKEYEDRVQREGLPPAFAKPTCNNGE